jgi:colanic acid/amylovoran biosynthesis glycosyltransferase
MRIVYVTSMLPFGPMEAFFIPEIRELQRRGHEVMIVPMWPRGPVTHVDARPLLASTVRAPILSVGIAGASILECVMRPVRSVRAVACSTLTRPARIAAKNAAVAAKGLWLGSFARRVRADHIHAQWGATTATMGWIAHQTTGIPWSFTVHRWDIAENNLLSAKAASARFVRAISERGAATLASKIADDAKVRVVHMGVEVASAPPREARSGTSLRVLTAANLLEIKGHRYLLEGIAQIASRGIDVTLDLAGGGPLEKTLRDQVSRLGLVSRVRFLGVVPHATLIQGLEERRWDVAVLASITLPDGEQEGIPVFLMEAMGSGLAVVATRTGGIPELIAPGAGLLIEEKDVSALASALTTLAMDPRLRQELGERAALRVREKFSLEATVGQLESLLQT